MISKVEQSFNTNSTYEISAPKKQEAPILTAPIPEIKSSTLTNTATYSPSFCAKLRSKEEQDKYNLISKNVDSDTRTKLNSLLKKGILLNNNSNDKSTVLDNLYKIASEPRIKGLETSNILKETITAIENPYTITQNFGDVPIEIADNLVKNSSGAFTADDLQVHSASCVATSIEFNLADKKPAEFTRMAAGLSSENYSVTKAIKVSDIADNTVDAFWLLNEFNIQYKMKDWNNVEVTLKPDRNAIIRSRIQTSYKDPLERSSVDVLLQSTFMNIGSQNTYNSLTDVRTGKYNPDNRGLTDIEKNFAETIAEGQPKISLTYQILDENERITGYECDFATIQKHLLNALRSGNNIIIGYTQTDETKKVINGHEITIIGAERSLDGKITFICNDTDDDKSEPIKWAADDLIPRIHHAGLPKEAVKEDVEFTEAWKEVLAMYKEAKENPGNNQQIAA